MENIKYIKTLNEIYGKKSANSNIMRENANINGDTAMGMILRVGSEVTKTYVQDEILPKHIADAWRDGYIHIHDADFYTSTETCCQIDLKSLLEQGFNTGHGYIRPPQSIRTAANLACIVIQSNQNEMHGGQSIPAFDYALAPYVQKTYDKHIKQLNELKIEEENIADIAMKMTVEDTEQAMEALVHNLNTMHSRAGAQVPFSSLNYGTDTSWQGRLVVSSVLKATENGLGNGETPIFPVQIFKVKEGVNYNPSDKNYDLFIRACEVSAKRLFPNFEFLDSPYNLQYYREGDPNSEVATMGCRTRVMGNVNGDETTFGRGNLSFTSINLPRLAIESVIEFEEEPFIAMYQKIRDYMELAKEQLLHRFEIQSNRHIYNYPFLMGQGVWRDSDKLSKNDTVGEVLKHGTLSIGFIGLAEALKMLTGKTNADQETNELGISLVSYMRELCDQYTTETGLNFSLLATPAEGLSGRFIRIDKEKYGIIDGVTDREYYTNSFHVPVYQNISVFEKIRLEAPYHALCNAGHISYIELDGDPAKNIDAFISIVKYAKEQEIGYFAINHPVDRDPICGYSGIIDDVCPKCGRKEDDVPFDRIRRITGYLVGTLDRWNDSKKAEEHDRVKHEIKVGGLYREKES